MSSQANELLLQANKLDCDSEDAIKEENVGSEGMLEGPWKIMTELKSVQKDALTDDKENRKQKEVLTMMAKSGTVGVPAFARSLES